MRTTKFDPSEYLTTPEHRKAYARALSETTHRIALSIIEAAKISGVSRSFIYNEMSAGRLRSLKVGGRRLIKISDLDAWLESFADNKEVKP